ncbi:MAG: phosphoenolpyruvate--protein phosphotransferase, partial [Alphaproteobacteria bacterium]|nr:phosphoenolpyruvate--protein phosphotransferase [Alphaproteobacteria bacterium]
VLAVRDGTPLVLDAGRGVLEIDPGEARLAAARTRVNARAARRAALEAAAQRECRTADGTRIEVLANIGSRADAEAAAAHGAEGCGLLRTEFLFLDRAEPPSEAEQAQAYAAIAAALPGRPVTVRTLDVGGDKPAPYLALPREDNPALGLRGVRVSLARRDLLDAQLGAILRAWPDAPCRIMLPMVASAAEVLAVRGRLEALRGADRAAPVALGIMVETPAAAVTADLLAPHVDFLSIGTNDLAQYALAMDRTHPELAAQADGLHPAVLRLIRLAAAGAAAHGRPVSVCGGLASDPAAVPILLGLGVTALSATPARIPAVKAQVRALSLDACRELAARACEVDSAQAVRALQPAPARRRARKGA